MGLMRRNGLRARAFRVVGQTSVAERRQVTIADLIGRALSKSNTSPEILGEGQARLGRESCRPRTIRSGWGSGGANSRTRDDVRLSRAYNDAMRDLNNRVALVTGGSRGIGAAVAIALAKSGADVAVNYRERADAANAVCSEITGTRWKAIAIQADISVSDDVRHMVAEIEAHLGGIRTRSMREMAVFRELS